MSATLQGDWTKPAAMAIPKGGYFEGKVQQGRYGPIFPKTPACYGFSIIAKIIPGREEAFYEYARNIEKAVADQPDCLAVLKLHYLRWKLFQIKGETYFQYQGIFDTDFDKYTEDAVALFSKYGINTVFENLEGFPKDWKTNARRRSSSSSAITSAQASWNTANIPTRAPTRSRKRSSSRRLSRTCSTRCNDPRTAHHRGRNLRDQSHRQNFSRLLSVCERQ